MKYFLFIATILASTAHAKMPAQLGGAGLYDLTGSSATTKGAYSQNTITAVEDASAYAIGPVEYTALFKSGERNDYPTYSMGDNNCGLVGKLPSPTVIFDRKLLPDGKLLPNDTYIEVLFNTQLAISRNNTSGMADGIGILCTSTDEAGEQPCSNTSMYPFLLRQIDATRPLMSSATYSGFVKVKAGTNPRVSVKLATAYGTLSTACYSSLTLRAGSIPE